MGVRIGRVDVVVRQEGVVEDAGESMARWRRTRDTVDAHAGDGRICRRWDGIGERDRALLK